MRVIPQKFISVFLWLALGIWVFPLTTQSQAMVLAQNPESFSGTIDDPDIEVVESEDEDQKAKEDSVGPADKDKYDEEEHLDTDIEVPSIEPEKVEADDLKDILAEDLEVDEISESEEEEEPEPSIEDMNNLVEEEQFQFDDDPDDIKGLNEQAVKEDPSADLQETPLHEFDIKNDIRTSPLLKYGIHDDLQNSFLLKYELEFSGKEAQKMTEEARPFGNYPEEGIAPKVGTKGFWDVPYKKTKKTVKDVDKKDPMEAEFAH